MSKFSTELIEEAVYKLCYDANICLDERYYSKISDAYSLSDNENEKDILKSILLNAKTAYEKKLPLCQDTGQVIVFIEIGQEVILFGKFIDDAINSAVEKCYTENYFRKSVVKNVIFDRTNTKTNTPVIIYTKSIPENEVRIKVLIKGAGSENKSKLEMLLPTTSEEEFINACSEMIISAEKNACPPMFIGIGAGATSEKAMLLSKEALIRNDFSEPEKLLAKKIKDKVNSKISKNYVLDINLLTTSSHIACMPVAITVNCHSNRESSCTITENGITYHHKVPVFADIKEDYKNTREIFTKDISVIKELKQGDKILLSGEIYIARDMAHKRLKEMIENNEELPFEIKDKIIFYAGPCPDKSDGTIGSIGPTTASRMDKYAEELYDKGLLATIGKGSRNKNVQDAIKRNNAKYFSLTGGIAALLSNKIKKKEVIAFEELGAEAIFRIEADKLPLTVEIA